MVDALAPWLLFSPPDDFCVACSYFRLNFVFSCQMWRIMATPKSIGLEESLHTFSLYSRCIQCVLRHGGSGQAGGTPLIRNIGDVKRLGKQARAGLIYGDAKPLRCKLVQVHLLHPMFGE